MKKINRVIAVILSVLLLAAAFCMTACKKDDNPSDATNTAKPGSSTETRKNVTPTTDPRSIVVETNWGLAADASVIMLSFKGTDYKLTAGELYALGVENISALDQKNALVRGGSINVFSGVSFKSILNSLGIDVSDSETAKVSSLVLTNTDGTETDLSDKAEMLSLFECYIALANNGKSIGVPENGCYFTTHTTAGSTDVAYTGVTAITIK